MKARLLLLSLLPVFLLTCATPQVDSTTEVKLTTIYLVRHAEKESGDDPALTTAGQARAQRLADLLSHEQLDAIYSTDYRRTQLTAQPVAAQQDLNVESYNPRELATFAEQIKNDAVGQRILVVGHSNSTPTLAGLLVDGQPLTAFQEDDYGNFLIVTIPSIGTGRCLNLRF